MQFYRQATYLFRFSGILKTLVEPPRWTITSISPKVPGLNRLGRLAREFIAVWAD